MHKITQGIITLEISYWEHLSTGTIFDLWDSELLRIIKIDLIKTNFCLKSFL